VRGIRNPRSAICSGRGFTLFEVLVAVSILSIAIVVILHLFSAGLRNLTESDKYVKAIIRAEAIMRDVLEGEIEEGGFSMTTEDGYDVDIQIKDVGDERFENLQVKLLSISMRLRWTEGMKERTIKLATLKVVEK